MARRRMVAAVLALGVLAGACSGEDDAATPATTSTTEAEGAAPAAPVPSAGCEGTDAVPGITDGTLVHDGVERRYQLHLPETYDGREPMPLFFGLHALTVPHTFVAAGSGLTEPGRDVIVVTPSGRMDGPTPYWFAAPTEDNHDVDFLGALLDEVEAQVCVDTARVYSTGMSNGAQMSSVLACQLSDRIAGIAPISGVEYPEPCPGDPVPVIAFHGDEDPILPYEGGGLNATTIATLHFWKDDVPDDLPPPLGIDESMRRWAEHNGCDPEATDEQISESILRRTWEGCEAETVLYVHQGGGHSWPGRPMPSMEASFGPGTTEIDATALMFELFGLSAG